eukprot:CAMPEP_0117418792 /NCGR_PEP_ID=MMETSP0758-20121206/500_1 /TAXON_ID=63605 /ORGANISM="Percolomonas cosmopolitus, Strain AE-1 (ATCC 50343)" /LENGTH=385 /DNA_ID=CAMNT_0005199503 /DNA_START=150 /DNA_END=1307 /DNA_ORIENTATION=-
MEEDEIDYGDLDIESTTLQGLEILDFTGYSKLDDDDFVLAKLPMDIFKQVIMIAQGETVPEKEVRIKGSWTEDEDKQLVQLVDQYGAKRWSFIASHLKGRVGKQCRERYLNHLDPSIKKTEWTEEEDQIIMSLHDKLGNQWAKIARSLKGRTANAVKNHWNSTLRRRVEKLNAPNVPVMQTQQLIPITQPILAGRTPPTPNLNTSFLFPLPENMNVAQMMNQAQIANQIQLLQNSIQRQQQKVNEQPQPQQQMFNSKRARTNITGGDTLEQESEKMSSNKSKKFKSPTIQIDNDNMKAPLLKTPQSLSTMTPSNLMNASPLNLSLLENNGDLTTPGGSNSDGSGLTLQSPSHVSLEIWSPKNSNMFSPCSRFLKINVTPIAGQQP